MAKRSAETAQADFLACRDLIRHGSRSFYMASLMLPARVRLPAYALYAFCRLSDDAVDGPQARPDVIARLRDRLDRVYAGRPHAIPADRAFAAVVASFDLPRALPEALLEGLSWDASGRCYSTLADVRAYAARVAAAVGAMMTVLMGVRSPWVLARACDLGVAMQLTNIARDVGEDARCGRLYLPLDWLAESGIDGEAFLARPVFDARVGAVVERLLAEADLLYLRSRAGVAGLPADCRAAIHAARMIYREIGGQIRENHWDSVSQRAVVATGRKLLLAAGAFGPALAPERHRDMPALPETQFLVNAAAGAEAYAGSAMVRGLDERVGWVIELFDRLDDRRPTRDGAWKAPLLDAGG